MVKRTHSVGLLRNWQQGIAFAGIGMMMLVHTGYAKEIGTDNSRPGVCSSTESARMHLVMGLVDRSGSVTRHVSVRQMLADMKQLVKTMPSGFRLYIRYITGNSYADRYAVYQAIVPARSPYPVKPNNPFDRLTLKHYHVQLAQYRNSVLCAQQARQNILADLDGLATDGPVAKRTDLYGAINATDEVFAGFADGQVGQKLLVVYSDLIQTSAGSLAAELPGLRNTKVIVRSYWGELSFARVQTLRRNFDALLSRRKLSSPYYLPMKSVPFRIGLNRIGILNSESSTQKEN